MFNFRAKFESGTYTSNPRPSSSVMFSSEKNPASARTFSTQRWTVQLSTFFPIDLLETLQVHMLHRLMDEEAQMIFPQLILHTRRHSIRLIRRVRQKSSIPLFLPHLAYNYKPVLTQSLKPLMIRSDLRGPFDRLRAGSEGPLFHGAAHVHVFFRSLLDIKLANR